MTHSKIKYGVSKSQINGYNPVVFVNGQSQYSPMLRAAKTAKGALKRAEKWANSIAEDGKHFGNTVEIVKWEHSVI